MVRLRKSLWAIAAITALPAPAAAQQICAALSRIAASAHEAPAFRSIQSALANGETVVPGFEAASCHVRSDELACSTRDFVADHFESWPDPLSCPGMAPATASQRRHGSRDRLHAYTLSGLHIEYGIDCMGCAGGANSYFSATIGPRRRPED
jgi:hypothetical protein